MKSKNTICLWFNKDAHEAARFYAATFPDSKVIGVHKAPSDYPNGKQGDVLTVDFTVLGIPCLGLNGGPTFKHSEAFSFQIATENQEETDRYWNAIVGNGGQESQCGWCKDRWGISWQITPSDLPGDAPAVLAPTALAFLSAIADDRIPVTVRLFLVLRRDLERKRLAVLERRTAVETEAGNTQHSEIDRQYVALFAIRVVAGCFVNTNHFTIWKGRGVEARRLMRVLVEP